MSAVTRCGNPKPPDFIVYFAFGFRFQNIISNMKNLVLTLLIIVCILNCVTNFEIQDIRKTFNGKDCIEGSLLSLENGPVLSTSSVLHKGRQQT